MATYGKKTLIASTKLKPKKPAIYALLEVKSNRNNAKAKEINASKCYCAECQKVVDIPVKITAKNNEQFEFRTNKGTGISLPYDPTIDVAGKTFQNRYGDTAEAECPECHAQARLTYLTQQTKDSATAANVPKNFKREGTWLVPTVATGRYMFQYQNEDGKTTRVDDNIMYQNTIVFPSYKTYNAQTELSENIDFERRSVKMTKTIIHGDDRIVKATKDSKDDFQYEKMYDNSIRSISINHTSNTAHRNHDLGPIHDSLLDEETSYFNSYSECVRDEDDKNTEKDFKKKKIDIIFETVKAKDELFGDYVKTGLFNSEHHLDQDNATQNVDSSLVERYCYMAVKYPVAIDYAIERTNLRVTDAEFKEKRRQQEDPTYEPKDIPDSAKCRMFREEMNIVSEQLSACDDKILAEVHDAKDLADMKKKLAFYAFGTNSPEAELPKHVSIKSTNELMTAPIQASKKLKQEFRREPIAVASNVYTLSKMNIKEPTAVLEFLEIGKDCPEVNQKPTRARSPRQANSRPNTEYTRNANVLCPIHSKGMLRFMKEYSKTHTPSKIQEIYKANDQMALLAECINLYEPIASNKNVTIVANKDKAKVSEHDMAKASLRNYLKHNKLSKAYVDYIEKYGDKTFETINGLARELREDAQMDKAKKLMDDGKSQDEILQTYPDLSKKKDTLMQELTDWVPLKDRAIEISTRDDKPIFPNRTLKEIHDELSNIAKKNAGPNQSINYTDKEKALEIDYPVPESERTELTAPDAVWSFRLIEDTHDLVRKASDLHNCMAGSGYADNAVNKRHTYMAMYNEEGKTVAAIDLSPTRQTGEDAKPFAINQFQSDHDTALPARYKEVALQWIEDCHLRVDSSDVSKFGTGVAIYGNGNADFHHDEIDETTDEVISISESQRRAQARIEKAKAIYRKGRRLDL